ncbi:hypothetical protein [Anaerococcus sp. Marseille-P3625]|uniref:hypothetical protein n=1 Tax=Anaerococcus sp. Marseille-P3625 TaxID=1977277 RepID=UPI000C07D2F4|nr:hypothetical protein [Anaerococcus sp. Marseille-P3625]
MIDKLARVDTYKGYMFFIKHIYRDKEYDNIFREMLEGTLMSTDWYNGYVILPDDHELVDKFYGEFEKEYDIEVHGGITFSDYLSKIMDLEVMDLEDGYVLGFDCNHAGDNPVHCNQRYVENECKKLIDQLINLDDCKVNNKNKEVDLVRNIDSKSRLVVKHVLSDKVFWVIEENHEGEWIEVLKICEIRAEADSVVNFYLENRSRNLC